MDQTIVSGHFETLRQLCHSEAGGVAGLSRIVVVEVRPTHGTWIESGLVVQRGETVSLLPAGEVWLSRELDIRTIANGSLWHRIGDGPLEKSIGATTSFVADRDGPLRLSCGLGTQWADLDGGLDPNIQPFPLEGGFEVAALAWSEEASVGLDRIAQEDASGLAAAEARRLKAARPLPKGWAHLWDVGRTGIFCEAIVEGRSVIACRCERDAGIVKHEIDVELTVNTALRWSWRVEQLPSRIAENSLPTHDYLSIAVEFDNGRDLTYFWSTSLPLETAFPCPIPGWETRETHVVVRSGPDDLGSWVDEKRSILADYQAAVGGTDPGRIVGVWLIALSPFQRGTGLCEFAGIVVEDGSARVDIGP